MSTEPRKSAFAGLKSSFNLDPAAAHPQTSGTASPNSTTTIPQTRRRKQQKPVGKRRDENYIPVSTFVHKDVHPKVRVELVKDRRDLADLLDELLRGWLRDKGVRL
ncbi:MAG TPA: hypothetical protein VFK06_24640 [Candidatus Angelobacter sp.]|nr:hypothetical protein [Candidatus Angelobacter sp.]